MNMKFWLALCAAALLIPQGAQATTQINPTPANTQLDPGIPTHTDATDYSNTGLDLGKEGYLFFNFGQSSPSSGAVGLNRVENLPSYISVDYDPNSANYSWGDDPGLEAFSKGGDTSWATITLPDGTTGFSGALVDPASDDNSNNTIQNIGVGAGIKSSILIMHIVTDNTNLDHDAVNRIRPREDVSDEDTRWSNNTFNGVPDVYSVAYKGIAAGDQIKVQLNSGVQFEDASIAGLMFDIPEPTSFALLGLGALGLLGFRRR